MIQYDYDVAIIGSGPGGHNAALLAAKAGLKTALIEQSNLGGVCLNEGCIPTKALIHIAAERQAAQNMKALGVKLNFEALNWKQVYDKKEGALTQLKKGLQFVIQKSNIAFIQGHGDLKDGHTMTINAAKSLTSEFIILALGSQPSTLPFIKIDEKNILSSSGILNLTALPENLLIIGGGIIGLEFAYIFAVMGVKVTIVECLPQILPDEDSDVAQSMARSLKKLGVEILTNATLQRLKPTETGVQADIKIKESIQTLHRDKALIAIGRSPSTHQIEFEKIGIQKTKKNFIQTDAVCRTQINAVFAIGDIIQTPMLAHSAAAEAEIAINTIIKKPTVTLQDQLTPFALYTNPQYARFGLTERQLQISGMAYEKATHYFRAIGKAVATDTTDGFCKIICDKSKQTILGAQIIGPQATEIIHTLLLAAQIKIPIKNYLKTITAHPTYSEIIKETLQSLI